jgi:4-amino-4-deoxy-L-arabinose transferase-like glycosyltransferase
MLARSMKTAESDVVGGRRPGGGESWRFGLLIVAPAVALHAAARLWQLDESCLWFDELFGVHAARHAWGAMPRFVALDLVHPPLFYLLLKVWMGLGGESVWWLRLLPAAASSLAAVPIALLARELKLSAPTAALALLLAAASGFLIKYAQEVRMYAPLLLFASCSLWLFARSCRAGDDDSAGPGGGEAGGARRRDVRGPALSSRSRPRTCCSFTRTTSAGC